MEGTGGTVNKPSHFPSHTGLRKGVETKMNDFGWRWG
jgi:hypothetical protein